MEHPAKIKNNNSAMIILFRFTVVKSASGYCQRPIYMSLLKYWAQCKGILQPLSKVEGLTVLSKVEGRRCLRSLLSFDLEALGRLAA
jgi:hypothetical protein